MGRDEGDIDAVSWVLIVLIHALVIALVWL